MDELVDLVKEVNPNAKKILVDHDYEIATQLLSSHREKMAKLITHRVPLEDVARGIELAGNKKSGSIKVTVESNY